MSQMMPAAPPPPPPPPAPAALNPDAPSSAQLAFWYLDGATDGMELAAFALEGIVTAEQMEKWIEQVRGLMSEHPMMSVPSAPALWDVKRKDRRNSATGVKAGDRWSADDVVELASGDDSGVDLDAADREDHPHDE